MELSKVIKELPAKPGVYRMIDCQSNVIYVGKAKNLKNRVSQYFRNQKDRAAKVTEMIHNIHTVEYQVTDTELDALIDECRMIKEIKPRYNRQLKNTGKYVYLKLPNELFPRLSLVKAKVDDGAIYFGPFTSPRRVESALQYLQDEYPLRKCTSPKLVNRVSGCLFRQLGTCLGVCSGEISPEEYQVYVSKIRSLLNGTDTAALHQLTKSVSNAVVELNFEQASRYQQYYLGLRHVVGKQRLIHSANKNRNILAVELLDTNNVKLFFIKGNKLLHREVIMVDAGECQSLRLLQYLIPVIEDKFGKDQGHRLGLTQYDIDEAQIIYAYLKKNKKRIASYWIPQCYLDKEKSKLHSTVINITDRIICSIKSYALVINK